MTVYCEWLCTPAEVHRQPRSSLALKQMRVHFPMRVGKKQRNSDISYLAPR